MSNLINNWALLCDILIYNPISSGEIIQWGISYYKWDIKRFLSIQYKCNMRKEHPQANRWLQNRWRFIQTMDGELDKVVALSTGCCYGACTFLFIPILWFPEILFPLIMLTINSKCYFFHREIYFGIIKSQFLRWTTSGCFEEVIHIQICVIISLSMINNSIFYNTCLNTNL